MRREHDANPVSGHDLHEALEELASGKWIEACHRLIEEKQLGSLGHGQRQRQLGSLATRQRTRLLARVDFELVDPTFGELAVPVRVEVSTHTKVLGDRQPGIGRRVLGDEANPRELCRTIAGASAKYRDRPAVGASSPTARCSSVVLPAPFGPTRPTTLPSGMDKVQSWSADFRPYCLPRSVRFDDGRHATPSANKLRTAVR